MLVVFGGLPGWAMYAVAAGREREKRKKRPKVNGPRKRKLTRYESTGILSLTVIARELARQIGAVYLRIDSIEQALRDCGRMDGPMNDGGYRAAYAVAGDNLCLGRRVIADCVNPLPPTREAWRTVARQSGVEIFEVEVTCSDQGEHKHRVERRLSDIRGLKLPTWQEVRDRHYEPWDREHVVVDSASCSIGEAVAEIRRLLKLTERARLDGGVGHSYPRVRGETPASHTLLGQEYPRQTRLC
jgi:predicted kinase